MTFFSTLKKSILPYGRVRRRHYIIRNVVCFSLMIFIGRSTENDLFNTFILLGILYFLSQTIKRLHDLTLKGWWILFMFIPIINILAGLFVTFKKGTEGYNQYGPDPKTNNQQRWSYE